MLPRPARELKDPSEATVYWPARSLHSHASRAFVVVVVVVVVIELPKADHVHNHDHVHGGWTGRS
ncbi:MAG: hypothetical protein HY720_03030 [Planctomycetes bacterium]|nr:hypothetical protein [Planctomycetota bacterium]